MGGQRVDCSGSESECTMKWRTTGTAPLSDMHWSLASCKHPHPRLNRTVMPWTAGIAAVCHQACHRATVLPELNGCGVDRNPVGG